MDTYIRRSPVTTGIDGTTANAGYHRGAESVVTASIAPRPFAIDIAMPISLPAGRDRRVTIPAGAWIEVLTGALDIRLHSASIAWLRGELPGVFPGPDAVDRLAFHATLREAESYHVREAATAVLTALHGQTVEFVITPPAPGHVLRAWRAIRSILIRRIT